MLQPDEALDLLAKIVGTDGGAWRTGRRTAHPAILRAPAAGRADCRRPTGGQAAGLLDLTLARVGELAEQLVDARLLDVVDVAVGKQVRHRFHNMVRSLATSRPISDDSLHQPNLPWTPSQRPGSPPESHEVPAEAAGHGEGRAGRLRRRHPRGTRTRTELVHWLGSKVVLPYDINVSWRWGQLIASAGQRGRPRPVNDTWIAACCLVAGLPLATLNVKDSTDFVDHEDLRGGGTAPVLLRKPKASLGQLVD